MLKKFIFVIALVVLPLTASADVIEPGQKYVPFCFELSGTTLYEGYAFIAVPNLSSEPKVVAAGDCASFYKFSTVRILAIENTVFDLAAFNADPADYIATTAGFVEADISIPMESQTVADGNPLDSVTAIYQITNLNNREFTLIKTQMVYRNTDGQARTELIDPTSGNVNANANSVNKSNGNALIMYIDQPPPESDHSTIYYIIIPAGAGILIALILLLRKK